MMTEHCNQNRIISNKAKAEHETTCDLVLTSGAPCPQGKIQAAKLQGFPLSPESDLQLLEEKIKLALASFTRILLAGKESVPQEEWIGSMVEGVLAHKSHVTFVYQSMVAEALFYGFETPDFHIPQLFWPGWEKSSCAPENMRQYKEIRSLQDSDPAMICKLVVSMQNLRVKKMASCHILGSSYCPPGCFQFAHCVCGRERFLNFCCRKVEQLMQSNLGIFWSQPAESAFVLDMRLSEQLLPLLTSVWLAHLLVNSFEPPALVLKMKRGVDFDPAFMKKVELEDEELAFDIDHGGVPRVAFMVVPGFRVGTFVVGGLVYCSHLEYEDQMQLFRA